MDLNPSCDCDDISDIIDVIEVTGNMASITIRNLDDETKERLRVRAAQRRRSMEDEVRHILRAAVAEETPSPNLAQAIRRRFEVLGGLDLDVPVRAAIRKPPKPGR